MLTSEVSTYVVQRTFSFLSFSYSQVYSVISAYIRLTWSFNNIFRNHFIDRMRLGPRLRALMTFLSPDVDVVTTFTLCRMFPGRFCLSQRQTRQREILLAFMVFWFCATSLRSDKDTQTNVHKRKITGRYFQKKICFSGHIDIWWVFKISRSSDMPLNHMLITDKSKK